MLRQTQQIATQKTNHFLRMKIVRFEFHEIIYRSLQTYIHAFTFQNYVRL